jgi:hypothetical protein
MRIVELSVATSDELDWRTFQTTSYLLAESTLLAHSLTSLGDFGCNITLIAGTIIRTVHTERRVSISDSS